MVRLKSIPFKELANTDTVSDVLKHLLFPNISVIVKDTLVLLHLNTDTFLLWKNRVPGWMGKNSI